MSECDRIYLNSFLQPSNPNDLDLFMQNRLVASAITKFRMDVSEKFQNFDPATGDIVSALVFEPFDRNASNAAMPGRSPADPVASSQQRPFSLPSPPIAPAPAPAPAPARAPASIASSLPRAAEILPAALRERAAPTFRLRNARQSELFDEAITYSPDGESIRLVAIDLPLRLGLQCDLATFRVHGTPLVSGEQALDLQFRFVSDPPHAVRRARLTLYVNPDPKLMWTNKPSDRSDPFWKADEAGETLLEGERAIVAARKRGRSHAHVGSCCDDDFFVRKVVQKGWHIAIVADGAGSASASRLGSRTAVQAAGDFLVRELSGELGIQVHEAAVALGNAGPGSGDGAPIALRNALYSSVGTAAFVAMKALHDAAKHHGARVSTVKDLSTTLLIGVARRIGQKWLCAAYWVGDGAVGVLRAGKGVDLLGEADSGEYSGQTRFLDNSEVSQDALLKRTRYVLVDDFTAFVLMTDGVSDPKFETEARLGNLEAWEELWKDLEDEAQLSRRDGGTHERLLNWLDFWSPGNHDDRTIAIIY